MKYIHYKHLPPRLPVLSMIVFGLLLDRFQAPGWLWGVVFTVLGAVFLLCAYSLWTREPGDVEVK